MFKLVIFIALFVAASHAVVLGQNEATLSDKGATLASHAVVLEEKEVTLSHKGATLKPLSVCCEIPELGDEKYLEKCSNPKLPGPCDDVACVFEESGFLTDRNTLNKEAYKNHLRKWEENNKGWTVAVDKAIKECVDNETRQYLDLPCKAYDVFACTGIAMLKKCPEAAWKCT